MAGIRPFSSNFSSIEILLFSGVPRLGTEDAPLCGAGMNPPFLFFGEKEKWAVHGPKRNRFWRKTGAIGTFLLKYEGRVSRCGGDLEVCTGCVIPFGNRDCASPHLGAWVLLSWEIIARRPPLAPGVEPRGRGQKSPSPFPPFPQGTLTPASPHLCSAKTSSNPGYPPASCGKWRPPSPRRYRGG